MSTAKKATLAWLDAPLWASSDAHPHVEHLQAWHAMKAAQDAGEVEGVVSRTWGEFSKLASDGSLSDELVLVGVARAAGRRTGWSKRDLEDFEGPFTHEFWFDALGFFHSGNRMREALP